MDVLVFDGDCSLCARTSRFVHRHSDRLRPVAAGTSQGQKALAAAGRAGVEDRSIVLIAGGRSWLRSAAIVRTLWRCRGAWRLLGWVLWLVPWPLRDVGYRVVARLRHRA